MRILFMAAVFPPEVKGGAEICAQQSALWLAGQGHQVAVLTTAKRKEDELHGSLADGLQMWRLSWPRAYSAHSSNEQGGLGKLVWHLQDHLDPRNQRIVETVIREFRPDVAYIHLFPGIGSNAFKAFRKMGVPVCYHVHDLALACLRCSMFKNGNSCQEQCRECRVSSSIRMGHMISLAVPCQFISPSVNTWNTLRSVVDLSSYQAEIIPDIDLAHPIARIPRVAGAPVRIIYVGRVHTTKGVTFLFDVLEHIATLGRSFLFKVVGSGPDLEELKQRFINAPWVQFTGHISPDQVAGQIAESDFLCTPSLWRENHPGVVRKAIRAGVPTLVSDVGGIPEMVQDHYSGRILPPGNKEAWVSAILNLLDSEDLLRQLQDGAAAHGSRYSTAELGMKLVKTLQASAESKTASGT